VAASALVVLISASTYAVSELGHKGAEPQDAELIISFKHPGKLAQVCRDLSEQEKKKLPVHMRPPKVCTRERADVRLRVAIDGREVVEKAYEPRGIWNDGNSIAIERMSVSAGRHRVSVRIGDTRDPRAFPHYSEKEIQFAAGTRAVVLFDKLVGFQWFESKQQEDSASPVRSGEKEAT
jgi:hypothetical protein